MLGFLVPMLVAAPLPSVIVGTVTYRERFAISDDAEVTVTLDRRGRKGTRRVAELKLRTEGRQVPIPFALTTPPPAARGERYELRAVIRSAGGVVFATSSPVALPKRGESVELRTTRGVRSEDALVDREWTLATMNGRPITSYVPTLRFSADGSLAGFAGVNRFSGRYRNSEGRMEINPGAMTRMAGPEAANATESEFVRTLERVNAVVVTEDELTLSRGDVPLLVFTR